MSIIGRASNGGSSHAIVRPGTLAWVLIIAVLTGLFTMHHAGAAAHTTGGCGLIVLPAQAAANPHSTDAGCAEAVTVTVTVAGGAAMVLASPLATTAGGSTLVGAAIWHPAAPLLAATTHAAGGMFDAVAGWGTLGVCVILLVLITVVALRRGGAVMVVPPAATTPTSFIAVTHPGAVTGAALLRRIGVCRT